MERHYKGYRYGDDRKSHAKDKVIERKTRRAKEQQELRKTRNDTE